MVPHGGRAQQQRRSQMAGADDLPTGPPTTHKNQQTTTHPPIKPHTHPTPHSQNSQYHTIYYNPKQPTRNQRHPSTLSNYPIPILPSIQPTHYHKPPPPKKPHTHQKAPTTQPTPPPQTKPKPHPQPKPHTTPTTPPPPKIKTPTPTQTPQPQHPPTPPHPPNKHPTPHLTTFYPHKHKSNPKPSPSHPPQSPRRISARSASSTGKPSSRSHATRSTASPPPSKAALDEADPHRRPAGAPGARKERPDDRKPGSGLSPAKILQAQRRRARNPTTDGGD